VAIRVRVKLNQSGMRELLRSEDVQTMLGGKAQAVAARVEAAGIRVEGKPGVPLPVTVAAGLGEGRARAAVILDHPAGIAAEAKYAILAASIDAARDA